MDGLQQKILELLKSHPGGLTSGDFTRLLQAEWPVIWQVLEPITGGEQFNTDRPIVSKIIEGRDVYKLRQR
ncbi:MAG: hypothetical protein M1352_02085 [Patescibacteria group bacterium]|nr:hypothetical protein [Patescibacteria group bacterium]